MTGFSTLNARRSGTCRFRGRGQRELALLMLNVMYAEKTKENQIETGKDALKAETKPDGRLRRS